MRKLDDINIGIYEKALPKNISWEERIKLVKECGYDFMEISIDETDERLARLEYSKEEIKEIRDYLLDADIRIPSMCFSGHRRFPMGSMSQETRDKAMELMEKAIVFADRLGIRTIQLAGYDVYYEQGDFQTIDYFKTNLKEAAIMAAKQGVLLGFETMETPFMDTVEKAMNYVSIVNSPYLQIYPDLGNLTNASKLYNVSVKDDLNKGKSHIVAAHLKETVPGKYREIPYGTGHTDFINDILGSK